MSGCAVCRTVSRDWVGCGGLFESDSGAGVWCPVYSVQCPHHHHTTTSLRCATPHHNLRYSVPSAAPALPQVSAHQSPAAPQLRWVGSGFLVTCLHKVFFSCHNPPPNQSFPAGPLVIHSTSETISIILLCNIYNSSSCVNIAFKVNILSKQIHQKAVGATGYWQVEIAIDNISPLKK